MDRQAAGWVLSGVRALAAGLATLGDDGGGRSVDGNAGELGTHLGQTRYAVDDLLGFHRPPR